MAGNFLGDIPGSPLLGQAVYSATLGAGTDRTWGLWRVPYGITITAVNIIWREAVTGANSTTGFVAKVLNLGTAGAGTTVIASKAFEATTDTATALAPTALTLSSTAANLKVSAGEVIGYMSDQGTTGKADPEKTVVLDFVIQ